MPVPYNEWKFRDRTEDKISVRYNVNGAADDCVAECLGADAICFVVDNGVNQPDQTICTFPVPRTQPCLTGCMQPGQICRVYPTSNSGDAYLRAEEDNSFPENVEYVFGDYGEVIDFIDIGLVGADINFHPAGLSLHYEDGRYQSEEVPGNWRQPVSGQEVLEIIEAWVIDSMEGTDFPHGPYSQFYILFFAADHFLNLNLIHENSIFDFGNVRNTLDGSSSHLKGVLDGECTWEICMRFLFWEVACKCSIAGFDSNAEEEWVANMFVHYTRGAYLHVWGGEREVRVAIRESDGGLDPFQHDALGRSDDLCGFELIDKEETKTPAGVWVPLYKYEYNSETNEYYKTDRIAMFLRVRTVLVP